MVVNVSIPLGSGIVTDAGALLELAAPAEWLFNTKRVCFVLQNKPPAASDVILETCGQNGKEVGQSLAGYQYYAAVD
jgi:hypothetical protein